MKERKGAKEVDEGKGGREEKLQRKQTKMDVPVVSLNSK
jgi:hypothetical protein